MFKSQVRRTIEVYVDDMITKSLHEKDHSQHLKEMFEVLRKYQMKLNLEKITFGVKSGKFLGHIVHQRRIEANRDKIEAIIKMKTLRKLKEVQKHTGSLAALNRFILKATDKCHPFFKVMIKGR